MRVYSRKRPTTTDQLARLAPRRRQLARELLARIDSLGGKLLLPVPDHTTALASDDLHHLGLAEQRLCGTTLILVRAGSPE
jgi:hypothetical protein